MLKRCRTTQKTINLLAVLALTFLSGCPQPPTETAEELICPGQATIDEAVELLALQKQNVQSFKATADCIISFPDEKGKPQKQNVNGVLYFVPPEKILFFGEKFGKICLGANDVEFWMLVTPGDTDEYWWGTKAQAAQCGETMLLNPADIAEGLGIVDVTTDWKLFHRGGYDILDRIEDGKRKKRVYMNACDYHISLIEFFDESQMKKAAIELSNYTLGRQGIVVPKLIRVEYYGDGGRSEVWLQMQLKQVVPFSPTPKQEKLFVRPQQEGYKEVWRLNELCEFELVE